MEVKLVNFEAMFTFLFGKQEGMLSVMKNYSKFLNKKLELWMFVPQLGKPLPYFEGFKFIPESEDDTETTFLESAIEFNGRKRYVRELKHFNIRSMVDLDIVLSESALEKLEITLKI